MSRSFRSALAFAAAAALATPAVAADVGSEIVTAQTHATLASQASDIAGVHMHLHHALNCLVGPNGTGFDAKELNPCANSGNGAIPDSTSDAQKKKLQNAASMASAGIAANDIATAKNQATNVASALKNVK